MKRFIVVLAAAVFGSMTLIPISTLGQEPASEPAPLRCENGPLSKTYGGTDWLVFSCDDQRSLVIMSAPGNPAAPYVFFLHPDEKGYRISGRGNADKKATRAAIKQLKRMTKKSILRLIKQTKRQ